MAEWSDELEPSIRAGRRRRSDPPWWVWLIVALTPVWLAVLDLVKALLT